MRVRRLALGIAIVVAALPSAAIADEVVEFVDGRYLKVESHTRIEAAIRLSIGARGVVVVPASRVETIEREGAVVYRAPERRTAQARQRSVPEVGEVRLPPGRGLRSRRPDSGDRPAPGVLLATSDGVGSADRP